MLAHTLVLAAAWTRLDQQSGPNGERLPVNWMISLDKVVDSLSSLGVPFFPREGVRGSNEAHAESGAREEAVSNGGLVPRPGLPRGGGQL